jgi:hypothetical protein
MQRSTLGISGSIARQFQDSAMTPLLALMAILMGIFAILVTRSYANKTEFFVKDELKFKKTAYFWPVI